MYTCSVIHTASKGDGQWAGKVKRLPPVQARSGPDYTEYTVLYRQSLDHADWCGRRLLSNSDKATSSS